MLDARVWLAWALTGLLAASATRNPLYVLLLLLVAVVVHAACVPPGHGRGLPSPLSFGLFVVPVAALFNGLTVHAGDTVLFRLPDWLPLLGGALTAEAFVYGAINGLVLTTIFAAFSVFNQVTPVRDLVGLTPRALHEAGVVLSIALTFLPQMRRSVQRIREAHAVRGHEVRGLRDWLPIFLPLLVSALERAMGLAEAMVARGYGALLDQAHGLRTQMGLVLGLFLLLSGWLARLFLSTWRTAGLIGMVAGAALIGVLIWRAGRAVPHTTYRPRRWTRRDTGVLAACAVVLAAFLLPEAGRHHYSPYPRLTLPSFAPHMGLATLGLLVPALLAQPEPAPDDTAEADQTPRPRTDRTRIEGTREGTTYD